MSILFTVADERFIKRPQIYERLAYHSARIAATFNLSPQLIFFGKSEEALEKLSTAFDKIYRFDGILLYEEEFLNKAFAKVSFNEQADTALFLHHDIYERLYERTVGPFSAFVPDVVDISYNEDTVLLSRPVNSFLHFQSIRLKPGSSVFIRNIMSDLPHIESVNEGKDRAEAEYIKIPFTKKRLSMPNSEICTAFVIVAGTPLIDSKNYIRYIQSAGEKMKGAALATACLHYADSAIKPHVLAETRDKVESDFAIIAAEDSFDMLETALKQGFTVYVSNNPRPMLLSVADLVIMEREIPFFEEFVKNLRKITFKPKKISKK